MSILSAGMRPVAFSVLLGTKQSSHSGQLSAPVPSGSPRYLFLYFCHLLGKSLVPGQINLYLLFVFGCSFLLLLILVGVFCFHFTFWFCLGFFSEGR